MRRGEAYRPAYMRRWVPLAAAVALLTIASDRTQACGDKFMLIGRGVRFSHAYAAVHPARILLVVPPKTVKQAAVRDRRLYEALKMAGHRLDTVGPAGVAEALGRERYDIVLAERADALAILPNAPAGAPPPVIVAVLEHAPDAEAVAARQRVGAVLNAPQTLPSILGLFDDMMAARLGRSRPAAF